MIRAIAAIDDKRGIAKNGGIPWVIPEDSRYYRDKTEYGIIVMGRETYEGFKSPLPNRRNLVVSHKLKAVRPGFEFVPDVDAYLQQAGDENIWIIGGAGLYETTLQYCQELYLTHVVGDFDCDRFFPAYPGYSLTKKSETRRQNGYEFCYAVYTKNR